jgi:hypothetical protein
MAKIGKDQAAEQMEMDGYAASSHELDGYTVAWETFSSHDDPAVLFKGLPDDACQCPHWGLVLKGQITYRYVDGTTDVIREGEAYYARPGHLPLPAEGTTTLEFSPTDGLQETMAVVMKNLEAIGAASN